MSTMMELKKQEKSALSAFSNFSIEEMKAAMKYGDVDVIQPCYSLLWRYDEELVRSSVRRTMSSSSPTAPWPRGF